MGFVLSILYFATNYLTPAYLFGPLADLHIEVILAALIIIVSIPALARSFVLTSPQSLAILGMAIAVFFSVLFTSHGYDGAVDAFLLFIPGGACFFFVCLHCNTKARLKILVLMMFVVCMFVVGRGALDLVRGVPQGTPVPDPDVVSNVPIDITDSPYFIRQRNGETDWIYRLQGLGEINDPNDLGQLLVCTIPLIFIFWREKQLIPNIFFVFLPACALLFGAYLTHSRGTLVALTAMGIVAGRRRIGTIPALVVVGVLVVAAMSLHFTGGRDISASAGEDRTALWGESLQLFKVHPFIGVGYGLLSEETGGLTAHNSVAVCAAEDGIIGLFFWSLFLFPTFRDSWIGASPQAVHDAVPVAAEETRFPQPEMALEEIDKKEINRFEQLLFLSLTGLLVAGWFLSRTFVSTLFLLGGMTEAVYQMGLRRGMITSRLRFDRVLPYSAAFTVGLIILLYVTVRVLNLSR
jgi:hypothetical protein